MINRVRTLCTICGHRNTLRITLGGERRQEHTFACAGCGIQIKVALDIDFENRIPIEGLEMFGGKVTQPKTMFLPLENCALCEDEGTVTNLDPTFLVSEEQLHTDRIFPWMQEANRIGYLPGSFNVQPGTVIDAFTSLGGIPELKRVIHWLVKAWQLYENGHRDLSRKALDEFSAFARLPPLNINQMAATVARTMIGPANEPQVIEFLREAHTCKSINESEYRRFQAIFRSDFFDESFSRQIGILEEYARGYDQLSQTLIYAIRGASVPTAMVASSRDLRTVKMFYGNCFEELAAALFLPACLNNIKHGRPFDQFAQMSLKKYLTINKANRSNPFADNLGFAALWNEYDSAIRNSSHHAALRVHATNPELLEYRSGDAGHWKRLEYSDYLLRCNRIMLCMMRLLMLQVAVAEDKL